MKKIATIVLAVSVISGTAQNTGIGTATPTNMLEITGTNGLIVSNNTSNWIAGNFGGVPGTGSRVVMGNLSGTATIGAHNTSLTTWSTLAINPFGDTRIGDINTGPVSLGKVKISTLAGQGNRMVVTDNTGLLATQPLLSFSNTVSSNGVTTDAGNNTKLGGVLNQHTLINGNGYTAAFGNHTGIETPDQQFDACGNNCFSPQNIGWQSFTAEYTGQLSKISFRFVRNDALLTFAIHDGEGVSGPTLLVSPNVSTPYDPGYFGFTNYDFATPGVQVVAGQKYTIAFSSTSLINFQSCCGGYSKGRNDALCACTDYWFKTYIIPAAPLGLYIGDGKVGINTTAPNYTLQVNGTVAASAAYLNLSDQRLKTNIKPLENALEKVLRINGFTFNWDQNRAGSKNLDNKNHIGFLAQEIETVLPQLVYTANDEDKTKSMAYGDMVPVLVQAIQERQQLIEAMQRQIDELEVLAAKKLKGLRKK